MTMYCTKCGKRTPDDSSFCMTCGAAIAPTDLGSESRKQVEHPVQALPVGSVQPAPSEVEALKREVDATATSSVVARNGTVGGGYWMRMLGAWFLGVVLGVMFGPSDRYPAHKDLELLVGTGFAVAAFLRLVPDSKRAKAMKAFIVIYPLFMCVAGSVLADKAYNRQERGVTGAGASRSAEGGAPVSAMQKEAESQRMERERAILPRHTVTESKGPTFRDEALGFTVRLKDSWVELSADEHATSERVAQQLGGMPVAVDYKAGFKRRTEGVFPYPRLYIFAFRTRVDSLEKLGEAVRLTAATGNANGLRNGYFERAEVTSVTVDKSLGAVVLVVHRTLRAEPPSRVVSYVFVGKNGIAGFHFGSFDSEENAAAPLLSEVVGGAAFE